VIKHALALAEKGLSVFPCQPRGKTPATKHGFKDATRDPQLIEKWWTSWPQCNIGVATGASSGIFVLDVDTKGVNNGETELRKLEAQHGALPATVESVTPSRGRHLFFKYPGWLVKCSQSEIASGIDVRGDNGYIVAVPSVGENGRRYYWSADAASAFADAPQWVLDRVKATTAVATVGGAAVAAPADVWRRLVADGVDEGRRNRSIARLAGHLLRRYVDPIVVLDILIAWDEARCRPPLGAREVTYIVDSICGREIKRRASA
jgi:Bifunctional DNA primase/polymerase, N-terminal/Primase C terminal 1 (PriCT-1)